MLHSVFEVMNLLTGKIISCRNVDPFTITQEVVDGVEALAKKYGIKSLLKFKYCREVKICNYDDKNDNGDSSIAGVDDEDEE